MKIFGFYHILLKNHWQEIIQEQVDCILKSELYNNTETIYIGCVGHTFEKDKLVEQLSAYPKFKVEYHGTDIDQYEYPTLEILKLKADNSQERFACFYIHTKGASFEKSNVKGFIGGNYLH